MLVKQAATVLLCLCTRQAAFAADQDDDLVIVDAVLLEAQVDLTMRLNFSLAAFAENGPDANAEEVERLNRVALFLGATTKDSHTHATIGLEYERRLSELIGVGAVAEASPDGRDFVGAFPVFFHPVGELALSIGPGFSVDEGHGHFLVRFGAAWDFELPAGLSLAPSVSYDLTVGSDNAIVYGLTLSYAF
jgi:hypothetical protein